MPKKYRRNCNSCGSYYEGRGALYCSGMSEGKCSGHPDSADGATTVQVKKDEAPAPFLMAPNIIEITRPSATKHADAASVSVHYSDEHIPYHDPRCLNILYQILEYTNPEETVGHGDSLDCTEISKYEKNPHKRVALKTEIRMASQHAGTVHAICHPDTKHTQMWGNHEDRIRRKIWEMCEDRPSAEILLLPEVQEALRLESLLGIEKLGWSSVPYPEHRVMYDRLVLIHGNSVSKHSAYTAKAEYLRYGKSGMSGHTHRRGVYEHRDYNGFHVWVEMGMLGLIRNDYVSYPDWQQGFNVVSWNKDHTEFGIEPVRIHDGVAYFRGKRFVGDSKDFGELAAA